MHTRTILAFGAAALAAGLAFCPFAATAQSPFCGQACPVSASAAKPAKSLKVPTLLVNSRRLRLNYNIEDVGPSGVSAVELWATRDGRAWARYSNEPPPSGPLVVQVAEEGKYGFAVVVRNGVGERSPAPKTGDVPQMWVVVDETKPAVKLHEAVAGRGPDAGKLTVSWTATDERLAARPVSLSIATRPQGPWTPVALSLENTGKHVWNMPKDHPYEFFVRVEAMDKAGNVGAATTPTPVKVDQARPRGVITGIDAEPKTAQVPLTIPAQPTEQPRPMRFLMGFAR